MTRKKSKPKPRTTCITMDMGEPVPAAGIHFNTKTGEIMVLNNETLVVPVRATIDSGYERPKGRKSLIQGNLTLDKVYSDPNKILDQYDLIYAIDTNFKTIKSIPIAITAAVAQMIQIISVEAILTFR